MSSWIQISVALVGVALLLAALLPFVRATTNKATMELLRSELDVEREARVEQERRCAVEIGELRGRMDILTASFARTLAVEVVRHMKEPA